MPTGWAAASQRLRIGRAATAASGVRQPRRTARRASARKPAAQAAPRATAPGVRQLRARRRGSRRSRSTTRRPRARAEFPQTCAAEQQVVGPFEQQCAGRARPVDRLDQTASAATNERVGAGGSPRRSWTSGGAHEIARRGRARSRPWRPLPAVWRSARSQSPSDARRASRASRSALVEPVSSTIRIAAQNRRLPRLSARSPSGPSADSRAARRPARRAGSAAPSAPSRAPANTASAGSSKYINLTILMIVIRADHAAAMPARRARLGRPRPPPGTPRTCGQKPNSGGMPARLNINIAMAERQRGRVRDRPERLAMPRPARRSRRASQHGEEGAERHRDVDRPCRTASSEAPCGRRAARPIRMKPTLLIDE